MKVFRSLSAWQDAPPPGRPVLTIGIFDGVHRGHRRLLERLVAVARASAQPSLVLTFDPHPVRVLAPGKPLALLMLPEDRLAAIAALGVDAALVLPFTRELAALTAEAFVREVFHATLDVSHVVAGPDTRFGHDRGGDLAQLRRLGDELGFGAEAVEPLFVGDLRVSSSAIRAAVREGDVAGAAHQLGRPFRLRGPVVAGDRRGRALGFPTANVAAREELLPRDGVYAGHLWRGEGPDARRYEALVSVGVKPTFGPGARAIEAYVLDFDGDLYGETVAVDFLTWLRPQERFDSVATLVRQMHADVAAGRRALAAAP
jgi:riboflavin kinase/FMN adenylyltransferase